MTTKGQLEQIQIRIEKLQKEITDINYFIDNALCKETKNIYQATLQEKQEELKLLLSQNTELLEKLKDGKLN